MSIVNRGPKTSLMDVRVWKVFLG